MCARAAGGAGETLEGFRVFVAQRVCCTALAFHVPVVEAARRPASQFSPGAGEPIPLPARHAATPDASP